MDGQGTGAGRRAVPLTEAARILNSTPDTLRKRLQRSGEGGYKLDGRWYVYVPMSGPTGLDPVLDSPVIDQDRSPVATGQADVALLAVLTAILEEQRAIRRLLEEQVRPMGPVAPAHLWQPAASFPLAEPTSPRAQDALPGDGASPSSTARVDNHAAPPEVAPVPAPRRPWWRRWGGQER